MQTASALIHKIMPNWCSNIVVFRGSSVQLNRIKRLFDQLAEKEKAEKKGQLPDFIQADEGYFFEIFTIGNALNYETRWSPNTDIIKKVADHFGVDFVHGYDEPMNGERGKVYYIGCVLCQYEK